MELSEVLLTKTGGETERQVYLCSRPARWSRAKSRTPEQALRFDLTVPFGALRGRARARTGVPRSGATRCKRLPRRTRPARAFPRVLPVRHRRDRQGCAVAALRRRDPGGDRGGVRRAGHRRRSPSSSTTASSCAVSSNLGIEGERQMLVLRELDKLDKRGGTRRRDAGGRFSASRRCRREVDGVLARALARWPRRRAGEARRRWTAAAPRCSKQAATNCARSCCSLKALGVWRTAMRSTCRSRAARLLHRHRVRDHARCIRRSVRSAPAAAMTTSPGTTPSRSCPASAFPSA